MYDGQMMPPVMGGAPDTVDKQVGADADDCYSFAGAERTDRGYIYHNYGNEDSVISAMRFQDLTIGQGDTIDNSFLSLYGRPAANYELRCRFYAEDADDGSVPESSDLDGLVKTSASYYWSAALSSEAFVDSPVNSFNAIIQEIVDRGGWTSGNSITILGDDEQSVEECVSWDYSGDSAKAAKLHIEYTTEEGEEYSLEIGAGSYAVTGAAVGLLKDLLIGAGAGSYALSGSPVSLPVDRVMGASAGSYSLTGAAVALLKDMLISVAAGSYTLTGSAVGLKRSLIISAEGGTYTLSGDAVSLLFGWVLAASAGSYTITGTDVDLLKALIMAAAGGTYTLTGDEVAFLYGKIMAAEGGSYVITGSDVDLLKAIVLAIGSGSYAVTGQTVDLTALLALVARYALHAEKRSFALTPEERSFALHAEKRSFDLTPEDEDE